MGGFGLKMGKSLNFLGLISPGWPFLVTVVNINILWISQMGYGKEDGVARSPRRRAGVGRRLAVLRRAGSPIIRRRSRGNGHFWTRITTGRGSVSFNRENGLVIRKKREETTGSKPPEASCLLTTISSRMSQRDGEIFYRQMVNNI